MNDKKRSPLKGPWVSLKMDSRTVRLATFKGIILKERAYIKRGLCLWFEGKLFFLASAAGIFFSTNHFSAPSQHFNRNG